MAMQLRGGMWSEHYPVLLGQLSYAQGLGEAGGAGRVELHVADASLDNEIPHREAGKLTLAMCQRDRRCRCQPGEISRLQIPMQRLFEPEDPVRLDRTGKFDAVRQVVGRVHVEHQQGLVADRLAHSTDSLRFLSHGPTAGLELDRAVAEFDEPR